MTDSAPGARIEWMRAYHETWSHEDLMKARGDGLITDDGDAWKYHLTHADGVGGKYDLLFRPTMPDPLAAIRERLRDEFAKSMRDSFEGGRGRQRDEFAKAALTGILAGPAAHTEIAPETLAGEAYLYADAMLAARDKPREDA